MSRGGTVHHLVAFSFVTLTFGSNATFAIGATVP